MFQHLHGHVVNERLSLKIPFALFKHVFAHAHDFIADYRNAGVTLGKRGTEIRPGGTSTQGGERGASFIARARSSSINCAPRPVLINVASASSASNRSYVTFLVESRWLLIVWHSEKISSSVARFTPSKPLLQWEHERIVCQYVTRNGYISLATLRPITPKPNKANLDRSCLGSHWGWTWSYLLGNRLRAGNSPVAQRYQRHYVLGDGLYVGRPVEQTLDPRR